jgi:hypothetical protein
LIADLNNIEENNLHGVGMPKDDKFVSIRN